MRITFKHDDGTFSILVTDLDKWFEEREIIFEAGIVAALHDALYVCKHTDYRMPSWVMDGAIRVVKDRMVRGVSKGKGPKSNDATAFKTDFNHLRRWLAVKRCLIKGYPLDKETFHTVSEVLRDSGLDNVKEDAVSDSYYIVENAITDPNEANKFFHPLYQTKSALGLKPLLKGVNMFMT